MKKMIFIAVACACVATPALADIITYDMSNASLDYTVSTQRLLVQDTSVSLLSLELDAPGGIARDDALIFNMVANFDLAVDLTMTQLGPNIWSGTGALTFTDLATGSNAVEAAITTTSIVATGNSLEIRGALSPLAGTSILVNRGDPWTFAGSFGSGGANADGVPGQITVSNPGSYDGGDILTLKFGYDGTVDQFFLNPQDLTGGEVKGAIVPVPAAVLLGFLGLGAAGLKLRRFA
jgi:hypothetical protein